MPAENDIRLDDGFSTTWEFENIPTVKLYEKEITPPQISGGGRIDTTTMRNLSYRTAAPKKLKTLGTITAVCAYASGAIPVIMAQINVKQRLTLSFPDGSVLIVWGWINEFTPGAMTEADQPTATVSFECSNTNNNGVEVAPDYQGPSGSTT